MERILDNNYYDLFVNNVLIPLHQKDSGITYLNERLSLEHVPAESMNPCNLGLYSYNSFPSLYTLNSLVSLDISGITAVQNNPDLSLFGKDVLIGIIDTGIDYRHQAFKNTDGTTRIQSIWDQTDQSGEQPDSFTFGSEYGREQINEALQSDNPLSIVPSVDTNGHGTAISSIAAGTPINDQSFRGVAPEADLVVVKLKNAKKNLKDLFFVPDELLCFQESDIMLAARYLVTVSQKLNKPIVICIALGTSMGGHDGNGPLSSYLDYLAQLPGIGVSISAGNEGNKKRHYYYATSPDVYYSDFSINAGNDDSMFFIEIWGTSPAQLSISITSPTREVTRLIPPSINGCINYNFNISLTNVWINNIIYEQNTGDQLILLRFTNTFPGTWQFHLENNNIDSFSFHAWLPSGNLITDETYFINADPNITITSPGNAASPLTVTAYNQLDNSILEESSRGYTRIGVIKPDIAAPGYLIPCAVPGDKYGSATGTGAAAAHTAGIMAMLFEWGIVKENYIQMTGGIVNRQLILYATRDSAYTYPNNIWGYGQVEINNFLKVVNGA
ncbi:S8 family peptidase [Lacrimispora celerecrescens]|uniref:S8 family peptidase n=1 Tax=Lacrimispora celerecrescens TaxID=29354 RepID=UPI001645156F|nr:S8 family peptidase [Lacrimispora celerecrescens]